MSIKIEILPKYRIAYVRQVGPYGSANVQTMQKLKQWATAKNLLSQTSVIVGISHDNPETTLPENCRYDAGIVISDNAQIDELVSENKLPGGKYAIYKVKHTAEDLQKAWSEIFYELAHRGYQIDERPIFERYIGSMVSNHYCEICVPIK
ncbi:AraC family transcriptional regulator [Bacillus sp. FJAT-42315]|uniref:AraC family transcriptional regulator n=1 Tax=Bacillus sp. FJAT-42315 TaxID=2014077 RepID=UPI000C232912|nr:GyrI-like domain-containing protein [Bacillus sp. FJAT-42315]